MRFFYPGKHSVIELAYIMQYKLNLPLSILILVILILCGILAYVLMKKTVLLN